MVDTTAMDTWAAWGTTGTGAGRGGLLTLKLLLIPTTTMDWDTTDWDTDWDTMEDTATTWERGLPTLTLTLLLTPRLTPTSSMAAMDSAMAMVAIMAILMLDTTGDKLF